MALITLRQLLDDAAKHEYAVPAFNVNNLEQIQAVMEAAQAVDAPVIMSASAGARKYAGDHMLTQMMRAAIKTNPNIPVCLHQDHGLSPEMCKQAIDLGFSSAMMDGSLMPDHKTPSTYEYNVDVTSQVAMYAHEHGASVEGEIGVLGSLETLVAGKEDGVGAEGELTEDMLLTSVEQATDFAAKTGVDALAIAIGTSHGAYKFTKPPTGKVLRLDRLREIHEAIPEVHLVMHGSSSVPQDWLKVINENGGAMPQTYGVPIEEIQEGIKHGVRKVNVDTDLRMASTGAIRQYFTENPEQFDPRKYLSAAKEAMKDICIQRYEAFGTAGKAQGISAVKTLEEMQNFYK